MTNAFKLDKRAVLQAPAAGRDSLNAPVRGWTNVLPGDGKLWASIVDISGRQYVAAGGVKNAVQTEICIRRRAGVVSSMRLVHGGFAYGIDAVLDRGPDWLILMCRKEPLDG